MNDWPVVYARLAATGVDPDALFDGPAHRLIFRLHALVVDREAYDEKGQERLEKLRGMLEWPDIQQVREDEQTMRQTEAAMAAYGITPFIPEMPPPGGWEPSQ